MSKPTSSVSTAISIRIDNELLQAVVDYAQNRGLINESGRMDKRGQANLSAAISDLIRHGLERSPIVASQESPQGLSDSVINLRQWESRLKALETAMLDRVCEAIAQQLRGISSIERESVAPNPVPSEPVLAEIDHTKNTKERILEAAARGFRTKGYSGIGIDALAKEAGVTSGAFYGYFRSKEDAFLETVITGIAEFRAGIGKYRSNNGDRWTTALIDYYFGRPHRENLTKGCALPIFSPEVIRSEGRVRFAYQMELVKLNEAIAAGLTIGDERENQNRAWVLMALMIGGVTLARAVRDESLSDRIAFAVHEGALAIAILHEET